MSSKPLTHKSTGGCCRKARPFFSIKELPQQIVVDFTNNKHRQGFPIIDVKILLRNGRTYQPVEDYSEVVIDGNIVSLLVSPKPGVYALSIRCTLDNPLRSKMIQDINLRVN